MSNKLNLKDMKDYAKVLIVLAFLVLGIGIPILLNKTAELVATYPNEAILIGFISTMALLAIVFKLLDF